MKCKKMAALMLGVSMIAGAGTDVFAWEQVVVHEKADDILEVDGKSGRIYLAEDEDGYNYGLKYLYDVSFPYTQADGDFTLGEVIKFLSGERTDQDRFINSAWGEKTADLWYPHMMWMTDQMADGLLKYWEERGIQKEAWYDEDGDADGIPCDYFVYTPTGAKETGDKYPLVVMLHGGREVAYQTETFGFCEIAAREGLILVAADETKGSGDTEEEYNALTSNLIAAVEASYPIDTTRIYVVGQSGGGSDSMRYSIANIDTVAACAVMDQPAALATRWWAVTDEQIQAMQEYGMPMVYAGGTADCNGLYGLQDMDYYLNSEGSEDQFISGWNDLMKAFNITGKDLTAESRIAYAENPSNEAEQYGGWPFDVVEDVDPSGTSHSYKCMMEGEDDLCVYITENRPHMASGYDAENIWSFISKYRRNPETGMSELIAE